MSGQDDADEARRDYKAPYTPHHTIPTIQKYQREKQERQVHAGNGDGADLGESRTSQYKDAMRDYWYGKDTQNAGGQDHAGDDAANVADKEEEDDNDDDGDRNDTDDYPDEEPSIADTSETNAAAQGAKQKRKGMKKQRKTDSEAERQVTDPVTHLPVTIRDYTAAALRDLPENDPAFGTTTRTATGLSNRSKTNRQLQKETHDMERDGRVDESLFPPPNFHVIRDELIAINKLGLTVGLVGTALIIVVAFGLEKLSRLSQLAEATADQERARWFFKLAINLVLGLMSVGGVWAMVVGVRDWITNRMDDVWEEQIWEEDRKVKRGPAKRHETETVAWLNSLLSAVWPLINPDLFTSLADTLEDVMQASLPRLVRMVSVDDIGQGSESIRILGIRWLPTGAAARSVASDGKLKSKDSKQQNDRTVSGEGEVDDAAETKDDGDDDEKKAGKDSDKQTSEDGAEKEIAEGMEAEEGDFVNMEVKFAYRARSDGKKGLKDRTKDMHLFMAFYLAANIKIPVWVDLRGIVGTMRLRLQLTPDPPFFALCTLTFLGQPKVDISCIPLLKRAPNIMDLPLISNFVQSSVDAAMAEYVAPKSLTLDLKDMLAGDDFKKDTIGRGILVVRIKRGYDFEEGDPGIPLIKDGGADPYVSLGWAKFGKPVWSTRVLLKEMEPCWEETAYLLVTPEELNVDERLRVQLWDSDRMSADDDLGRIEVDLKQLMKDEKSNGTMCNRTDGFRALKAGKGMPGKLEWSVGYFSKVRLQSCQLQSQTFDPDIRTMDQLEAKVDQICKRKLREAKIKDGKDDKDAKELEQQKVQERKVREDGMIISAPPPEGYPSGIFSIQIHQITGLSLETLRKDRKNDGTDASDEEEEGEDLPSAYCTVIVNHSKAFKTRVKPKNAKPFYNAGVERYIPNWETAEVYISVRDARIKEDDPLLGIVHLPLSEVFQIRSQINGFYPLTGGVGHGRIRLSMVWRSVQLQAPPEAIGWEYGTLEVKPSISAVNVPQNLQQLKIRFHTDIGFGKMYPSRDDAVWDTRKKTGSLLLPVRRRYSSCVAIQFHQHGLISDKTAAFAILWLRDIPDEDEKEITLPVWNGDYKRAIASCRDEPGEKVGEMQVKLTFWSGLGGAHSRWASKDPDMRDVVEVLDTARDNYESFRSAKQAGIVDEDVSSSSDADSSEDGDEDQARSGDQDEGVDGRQTEQRPDGGVQAADSAGDGHATDDSEGGAQGKQSLLDRAKSYKKNMKSEHRRNRGVMQWRIPRTAKWAVHKAEAMESKVSGLLKHHDREPDVQTEV